MTLEQDINKLKAYFLSKDGGIMSGEITPDTADTYNLGRSDKRWDTIYAREIVCDVGGGGGNGEADTVDGYHAAGNPIASTLLALSPQAVFPITVYTEALIKDGTRALEGNMAVSAGATIDGVDISEHTHTGAGSEGEAIAHADLTGLDADDHPHYTQRAQDEIVTGDWMFTHLQDRSAGWLFLPDDKVFKAVPHNMIFTATATEASIGLGPKSGSPLEHSIFLYDDDTPTAYIKIGRGDASITLSGSDATYRLWAGDEVAADAPFHIKNSGAILAESGVIAGWNIDAAKIYKNNMSFDSVGRIIAGAGNEIVQVDAIDETWRIWVGHATASIAPWRVNKLGQMYMYDAFVVGTLKSANFISGQQGFSLDSSGLAEFDNIIARGRFETVVFAESVVSVASGKLIITDGAVLAADVVDTDDFIIVDAPVFQQHDILRLKPDATRDEYMHIVSQYSEAGGGYKYFVARGINDTEPTYAGPYNYYIGESVARHGSAYQINLGHSLAAGEEAGEYGEFQAGGSGATSWGGYLTLEGSRSYGPFFGVSARYGPVFDQVVDVVRIGNLNGILDFTTEEWGAFFGDANQYFLYDQESGIRIEFSGLDVDSTIDKSGMRSERFRFAKVASDPDYVNFEALMYYKVAGGNQQIKVRFREDDTYDEFSITGVAVKVGIPTPAPDGGTTLFNTPDNEPYMANGLMVFVQGVAQKPGTDFIETNPPAGTFTMTTAPTTGVTMVIQYAVNTSADYSLDQSDHGQLTGLADNDHDHYLLRDGSGNYMTGPLKNLSGDFQIESESGTFVLPGTNLNFFLDASGAAYFIADGDNVWNGLKLQDGGAARWHIGQRGDDDLHIHRLGGSGIVHFNAENNDVDVRMEGVSDAWLFHLEASENVLNLRDTAFHTYFDLEDVTAPATPAAGYGRVYVNADDLLFKDDSAKVTRISGVDSKSVTIGNGLSVIETGDKLYFRLYEAARLDRFSLMADGSGNLVVVLKKTAWADFPGSWSTVVTMTLSSAQKVTGSTGWDLDAGYVYKLEVTGAPTVITLCGIELAWRMV